MGRESRPILWGVGLGLLLVEVTLNEGIVNPF
jgi:hypothetical protein